MINLDFQTLSHITSGTPSGADVLEHRFTGVSIDSRTVKPNELFCAIRGERFDGHKYINIALENGAAGALVDNQATELPASASVVTTNDTHQALIDLAIWHRKEVGAKSIGITGSVGKTMVKEMVAQLLRAANENSFMSIGNLNNLYGLPLSLLRMDNETEYGVFELGISMPGEMARLAPILEPNVGVITNIAAAHLETLGSLENVRKEKLTLMSHLQPNACAVVNIEDPETLTQVKQMGVQVITFGGSNSVGADFSPTDVTVDSDTGSVSCVLAGSSVTLPLFGEHHVTNAACSLAACSALGVSVDPAALMDLDLSGATLRGEQRKIGGATFIMDCYNASPISMRAGVSAFLKMQSSSAAPRIAVLGDMLELGASSIDAHKRIGADLAGEMVEGESIHLITVGNHSRHIGEVAVANSKSTGNVIVTHVSDTSQAARALEEVLSDGALVYLKGSRGIALEEIVSKLEERDSSAQ